MSKLSDREVKNQTTAEIQQPIAMLEGSLTAGGWDSPAGQIDFLLNECIEPVASKLQELRDQAESPSGYRPGIPEGMDLPGLHEAL